MTHLRLKADWMCARNTEWEKPKKKRRRKKKQQICNTIAYTKSKHQKWSIYNTKFLSLNLYNFYGIWWPLKMYDSTENFEAYHCIYKFLFLFYIVALFLLLYIFKTDCMFIVPALKISTSQKLLCFFPYFFLSLLYRPPIHHRHRRPLTYIFDYNTRTNTLERL